MRIISGKHKGLHLAPIEGADIRPTSDRAKESLFDLIRERVEDARVLDLFCGSGSLGLECASRGCKEVVFNDASRESLSVLKKNIQKMRGDFSYTIKNLDYLECLKTLKGDFDIIFLDPPYKEDFGARALETIGKRGLLKEGGVAVFESDKRFEGAVEGLEMFDERKYGKTVLSFFEPEGK